MSQIDHFIPIIWPEILKNPLILSHWFGLRLGKILLLLWLLEHGFWILRWVHMVLQILKHVGHILNLSLHSSNFVFIFISLFIHLILVNFLLFLQLILLLLLYIFWNLTLWFYNPAIKFFIPNFASLQLIFFLFLFIRVNYVRIKRIFIFISNVIRSLIFLN